MVRRLLVVSLCAAAFLIEGCGGSGAPASSPIGLNTGTFTLSSSGTTTQYLGLIGGITKGNITFPLATSGGGATGTFVASASPGTGVGTLSTVRTGSSATTQASSTKTGLWYATITFNQDVTFAATPTADFQLAAVPPGEATMYMALYDPTAETVGHWTEPWGPAATTAGFDVSFTSSSTTTTFKAGVTYTLALLQYTGTGTPGPTASPSPTPSPSPVPTPTPTPSPTPSPGPTATPTPVPIVANGGFETGSLAPWFTCYAQHHQGAEVDPSPVDSPSSFTSPTPGPDTAPTAAPSPNDATIQTTTPTGSVHDGSYAALVGYSYLVNNEALRGKGASGICQTITIPTGGNPQLTLWVYEGGNNANYARSEQEADVFAAAAGLSSSTPSTTTLPVQTLFGENNCYNNLDAGSGTSDETPCNTDGSGSPDLANGGQWREKGPFSLSAYAGQTITLFLGTWNNTGAAGTYFNYAYFDDVTITP